MSRSRDLEGRPTRILAGTAKRLNAALEVLGIEPVTGIGITQTDSSLKINGQVLRAVKSYTTTRAIEFDDKVRHAIRSLLLSQDYDINRQRASHAVIRKELEDSAPDKYLVQHGPTAQNLADYVAKAQAVVDFWANEYVKKSFAENDALNSLFDGQYDEVIMD